MALLVSLAIVLEDEDIHRIIENQPDTQIDGEDPHGPNLRLDAQYRGQDDQE